MSSLELQFMGGCSHIQGGFFSLGTRLWKHPHRHTLRYASYVIPNPIQLTVKTVSELKVWMLHLLGNFTVPGLFQCVFWEQPEETSLDNLVYLPGQQHAGDPIGA